MSVDINNSMLTEKALDYAKLSDLAYAEWTEDSDGNWVPDAQYRELWREMKGKGYSVYDFHPNDLEPTGFSATIFQKDNKKILSIRGSTPTDDPLDIAADAFIASLQIPPGQYESMVQYITSQNLNQAQFDITGHSLGGYLAQAAKATFLGTGDVYTYNAPGAKSVFSYTSLGTLEGKVIVQGLTGTFLWEQSTWDAYQNFLTNKDYVDGKIYNISGKGISKIAECGTDIGQEVFISNLRHGITPMINDFKKNLYYIDPRKPVSFIGSKENETIRGDYNSGHYGISPIQNLTIEGGYGNDTIYGSDGNDVLYGDLDKNLADSETARRTSGNASGRPGDDFISGGAGNDVIYGGKGNDILTGGSGNDTYIFSPGDGQDIIKEQDKTGGSIIYKDISLMGGKRKEGESVYTDKEGNTYAWNKISGTSLVINSSITVENFTQGKLGIILVEEKTPIPGQTEGFLNTAEAAILIRRGDPLILDLDNDGIETTNLAYGVNFDLAADGFAEKISWVAPDDGFLVMDRNNNGTIDNGTELFGNTTLLSNSLRAWNGFAALSELDVNHDNKIDVNDPAYADLRVWRDANTDGTSSSNELFTLNELDIRSVSTGYIGSTFVDSYGNEHRQLGSFTRTDGTDGKITDVWFRQDTTQSIPTEHLDEPSDITNLPDLQGYGNVYDLHQAMIRDTTGTLKALIEQFIASEDSTVRDSLMEQILFKWTGSGPVDPASRGPNFDARKLAVLESFLGKQFVGADGTDSPNELAALSLAVAYQFYSSIKVQDQ